MSLRRRIIEADAGFAAADAEYDVVAALAERLRHEDPGHSYPYLTDERIDRAWAEATK
jgi:hypothetical protein